MPGVPSVDLTPFLLLIEMSFGPEIATVCVPERPGPKIKIVAVAPRATAPPTLEAEIVVAPGEFTPSSVTLNAAAVFGTMMFTPLVGCPLATVTTCGVVRLPPEFAVPPVEGGVAGGGVVVVDVEDPPPQAIQQTARSNTGRDRNRIFRVEFSTLGKRMLLAEAVLYFASAC